MGAKEVKAKAEMSLERHKREEAVLCTCNAGEEGFCGN